MSYRTKSFMREVLGELESQLDDTKEGRLPAEFYIRRDLQSAFIESGIEKSLAVAMSLLIDVNVSESILDDDFKDEYKRLISVFARCMVTVVDLYKTELNYNWDDPIINSQIISNNLSVNFSEG